MIEARIAELFSAIIQPMVKDGATSAVLLVMDKHEMLGFSFIAPGTLILDLAVNEFVQAAKNTAETMVAESKKRARDNPLHFIHGKWGPPHEGVEPDAILTYTDEPSPETGHVGWCWWAAGKMGDAPTPRLAQEAAEAAVRAAKGSL